MARRPTERPPRSACITPAGAQRLREEYDQLRNIERPRVTQEVAEAAAQGDRSENAEYIYGKKRLREIDGRLEFLTKRLDEVQVIEPRDVGDGRVHFGAWVRLQGEEGAEVEYQIVGPDEFDVASRRISIDSPVGRALLGRVCGDEVIVRRPKGDIAYEIREVRYDEDPVRR